MRSSVSVCSSIEEAVTSTMLHVPMKHDQSNQPETPAIKPKTVNRATPGLSECEHQFGKARGL